MLRASLLAAASAVALCACGSATVTSATPWAASHPDPPNVHFAAAGGLCVITVRYPQDAPGEIDAGGSVYIQLSRGAVPANPGTKLGTSGDWTLYRQDAHTLLLATPQGTYRYRDGANCGSNSAPPT